MKKPIMISLIVLGAILLLAAIAVGVFCIRDRVRYGDFYDRADKFFPTPGISDGMVQQGFCYDAEQGLYYVSAYSPDKAASRIYILDEKGRCDFVELRNEDGSVHTGHVGGIACEGKVLYVTYGKSVLMYYTAELLSEKSIKPFDKFKTGLDRNSFIHAKDGMLYVGEFYDEGKYETDAAHHQTSPAGEKTYAIALCFSLDAASKKPQGEGAPLFAMTLPNATQGMTIDGQGRYIFSTSHGLADSRLYVYTMPEAPTGVLSQNGAEIPLYHMDSKQLVQTIVAPPMAEELVFVADRDLILIMNESACKKYFFGKLTSGRYVQAYRLGE